MAWVGNDEQQLLEQDEEDSDGCVQLLEDDPGDESVDGTDFLELAKFRVRGEPLLQEDGGGEEGGEEESENGRGDSYERGTPVGPAQTQPRWGCLHVDCVECVTLKWRGGHIRPPAGHRNLRMAYSRSVLAIQGTRKVSLGGAEWTDWRGGLRFRAGGLGCGV